ncbi:hypothetical protein [Liquorilactobacillus capillatus]|uniref:Membrane protein 6-pyruvoyl-tetrahydropterin synthase-related domain-containing protein n=1 Tax=Liquorilactobacillus capillatus DSM 19910 TaxID=1423731 RepID=A0A0R1MAC1_9LACO|nr:hypothetical protein [Liquorilactobacillus capillatus]KRL02149.1 hypothetical protein FC81_GL000912 [Liquorilactobacillus capillatus DSM 19910]
MKQNIISKNKYIKIVQSLLVIILFLTATIIMVKPFFETQRLSAFSDWLFHVSRVEEIYRNLQHGKWFTFIATATFQKTGVGSFLFYPTVFLYPWALLRFYFNPVSAFYIWYGLITFATYLISYFCMLSFSKSKIRSIVFAFIYVLAAYRLYLGNFVFGEFIAVTFLPLVFLGFYELFFRNGKKWYIFSVGMSLLIYSHVLSVVMTIEVLIICVLTGLFLGHNLLRKRFFYILMSASLIFLMIMPVVIPFITDFINHNVTSAKPGVNVTIDGFTLFQSSISNVAKNSSIGLLLLATLFLGWYWVKNKPIGLFSYILGVFLTIISTSVFPWGSFRESPLAVIQLPWRYLSYANLFLAIVASDGIYQIYQTKVFRRLRKGAPIIFILGVATISMFSYFSATADSSQLVSKFNQNTYLKPAAVTLQNIPQPAQLDKDNYKYQFSYLAIYGETDYYPEKAQKSSGSIINNLMMVNGRAQKVAPISSPNALTYKVKLVKHAVVDVPAVAYARTYVYVNSKRYTFNISKRGTVQINLPKGNHTITVGYNQSKLYYCSVVLAGLSWITLVTFLVIKNTTRLLDIEEPGWEDVDQRKRH